jgi:small nuclear ribonucleoprotein (snRNP)-like protein
MYSKYGPRKNWSYNSKKQRVIIKLRKKIYIFIRWKKYLNRRIVIVEKFGQCIIAILKTTKEGRG